MGSKDLQQGGPFFVRISAFSGNSMHRRIPAQTAVLLPFGSAGTVGKSNDRQKGELAESHLWGIAKNG
ncbi:MAG: hypothetical protein ACOYIR_09055 [Christensenellales bacterium]|jgi:hypothetical protein